VRTTYQFKTSVGAHEVVQRDAAKLHMNGPPVLVTNITVPTLQTSKRSLHFLPDQILVREGRSYAEIPYPACSVTVQPTNFILAGAFKSPNRSARRVFSRTQEVRLWQISGKRPCAGGLPMRFAWWS
jgi:hypothetical protein